MHIKKVKGNSGIEYSFVKIGKACLSDTPLKKKNGELPKFNGVALENWCLKLELLVDEKILDAEQSCYLIFDDNEIKYIGYYSNSFKDRWWKKDGYFWHGEIVDKNVNDLLKKNPNKNITVWLSIEPYAYTKKGEPINISKYIEDDIIMTFDNKLIWNTVGKNLQEYKANTESVTNILKLKI